MIAAMARSFLNRAAQSQQLINSGSILGVQCTIIIYMYQHFERNIIYLTQKHVNIKKPAKSNSRTQSVPFFHFAVRNPKKNDNIKYKKNHSVSNVTALASLV